MTEHLCLASTVQRSSRGSLAAAVVAALLVGAAQAQTDQPGAAAPATGSRWLTWHLAALLVVGLLFVVFLLLHRSGRLRRVSVGVVGGVVVLVAALLLTSYLVTRYHQPGQTTLLEANTMDMATMRAPQGSTPVATEVVQPGSFGSGVTYTGTVVAYNDEDVYPRVTGTVVELPVYPGDQVQPGQLLARLDDTELSAREQAASWEQEMRRRAQGTSQQEVEMATAARRQAEAGVGQAQAEVEVSRRELTSSEAMVRESRGMVRQAEQELEAGRSEVTAAQEAQAAAQAEAEMASAGIASVEADLESARADWRYWQAEIEREQALLSSGAVSLEEYQREQAEAAGAQSRLDQAQAMLKEKRSAATAAAARARQAEADIGTARSRLAAMGAALDQARARVERAQADRGTAEARTQSAQAMLRSARAMVDEKAAGVQASVARTAEAGAALQQSREALTVAQTVRGYTEIRARLPGRVTARLVSPGVLAQAGTLLLKVAQVDRVRLQAYVTEQDLAWLRVGYPVEATSPKLPGGRLTARLTSIFPAADPTTRTAIVEAVVTNPQESLAPGDALSLKLLSSPREGVLSVPNSAIVFYETAGNVRQTAVWLAQGEAGASATVYTCPMHPEVRSDRPGNCPKCGMTLVPTTAAGQAGVKQAHRVDVTLGATDGERTEILSGLQAGEEVIYYGHTGLSEGDSVYPVPWGAQGPLELPPGPAATPSEPGANPPAGGGGTGSMPGMKMSAPGGTGAYRSRLVHLAVAVGRRAARGWGW